MKLTKQDKIERKEYFIKVLRNTAFGALLDDRSEWAKTTFGLHVNRTGDTYKTCVYTVNSRGRVVNMTLYVGVIGEFKMSRKNRAIITSGNPENIIKGILTGILGRATVYCFD